VAVFYLSRYARVIPKENTPYDEGVSMCLLSVSHYERNEENYSNYCHCRSRYSRDGAKNHLNCTEPY